MLLKSSLLLLLTATVFGRTYPLFKQCDPTWANDRLGFGSGTICSDGCLVSSVAMALTGTGHGFMPNGLNNWLKANGGYVQGDWLVWASVNPIGLTFQGKFSNSMIKQKLGQGYVVILNVHNGNHYVLAYGYNQDTLYVNDPSAGVTTYTVSQCVDGQTGVYTPHAGGYHGLMGKMTNLLRKEDDELMMMADRPRVRV